MGDDEYDFNITPYTDTTVLDALTEEMNDVTGRWAWSRQIYGHVFGAKMDDAQGLHDFGITRNDPHTSILGYAESPSVSWRRAAALGGQAAASLRIDPARPLQTLVMTGVTPPARGKRFKLADNNTLLYAGVATEMASGGAAAISRCITQYRVNAWNQPDPSWLDVQTPATLAYIIRFLRQRITQKFGRHKLADDGTPFGYGQAIVTPRIIRAELVAAYSELISMGVAENMQAFKAYLIVERDQQDPNRINVLLPPDLINQLRIFAMLVEFRLQSPPGLTPGAPPPVAPIAATA
jgi:phage tail sheath gpL-like